MRVPYRNRVRAVTKPLDGYALRYNELAGSGLQDE